MYIKFLAIALFLSMSSALSNCPAAYIKTLNFYGETHLPPNATGTDDELLAQCSPGALASCQAFQTVVENNFIAECAAYCNRLNCSSSISAVGGQLCHITDSGMEEWPPGSEVEVFSCYAAGFSDSKCTCSPRGSGDPT